MIVEHGREAFDAPRSLNLVSHDYRKARKEIVWDVIEHRIPAIILLIVD